LTRLSAVKLDWLSCGFFCGFLARRSSRISSEFGLSPGRSLTDQSTSFPFLRTPRLRLADAKPQAVVPHAERVVDALQRARGVEPEGRHEGQGGERERERAVHGKGNLLGT
jgi:hypothetical protein